MKNSIKLLSAFLLSAGYLLAMEEIAENLKPRVSETKIFQPCPFTTETGKELWELYFQKKELTPSKSNAVNDLIGLLFYMGNQQELKEGLKEFCQGVFAFLKTKDLDYLRQRGLEDFLRADSIFSKTQDPQFWQETLHENIEETLRFWEEGREGGSAFSCHMLGYHYGTLGDDKKENFYYNSNRQFPPSLHNLGFGNAELFKEAAQEGYAPAQFELFARSMEAEEAFKWLEKAANQNHPKALYCLGDCYERGILGCPQDDKEAFKWYLLGAEKGDGDSQYKIGEFYKEGKGCDKDDKKAFYWIKRAAKKGDMKPLYQLGIYYYHGQGVDKNFKKASKCLKTAAKKGHPDAQSFLDFYFYEGMERHQNPNSTQPFQSIESMRVWMNCLKEMRQNAKTLRDPELQYQVGQAYLMDSLGRGAKGPFKALQWTAKADLQGHEKAKEVLGEIQNRIGYNYFGGMNGFEKNLIKASEWMEKTAVQGYEVKKETVAWIQNMIASRYRKGSDGFEKNNFKALEWFEKAESNGYKSAKESIGWIQYNIGYDYLMGWNDFEKDNFKAIEWFEKAASNGCKKGDIHFEIGCWYFKGENGLEKNFLKAIEWFRKSTSYEFWKPEIVLDNVENQYKIGIAYRKGRNGLPKDDQKAVEWPKKAAAQKHVKALYKLGVYHYEKKKFKEAHECFKAAADAESPSAKAQYCLGICLYEGIGCEPNRKKALEYFEKAAAQGHEGAQYNLGIVYARGEEEYSRDLEKALEPLKKAAQVKEKYMDRTVQDKASYLVMLIEKKIKEAFLWPKKKA